ncbi:hypothetical protein GYMLUDRAFT_172795 [Collybiopsis luxurians FD-317 M1]|uniref:Uncharacterized protein n=1 Tax=Collybiopsis luxurians FD-317 M1 TaxID=944289 RepID=A0A0D0B2H4_9AGAR|nr:hypothetical protein GYMLUDRAFT_172795 [Collybiopsis luxurians FD-317 M1]
MVNFTILAGGFAVPGFISTYVFSNDSNTLSIIGQSVTGDDPSWIALHPNNSRVLYAVNEIQTIGNLQSFTVNNDSTVSLIDTVSTQGVGPTFTNPLSTGEVSAMNFGSPNCSFISTDPNDPLTFQTNSPGVAFPIPEGGKSNPHMSLEYNDEVLVADLGADKIWRLGRTGAPGSGSFAVQGQIDRDPGSGPRRLAILDDILFVVSETTSTLTAQRIPNAPNGTTTTLLANVSTFPTDALPGSKFAAAELLISTPTDRFPNPLIYVSNRNIGSTIDPKGDTIAIFEFVNGTSLTLSTPTNTSTNERRNARMKRVSRSSTLRHQRDSDPELDGTDANSAGYSFNLIAQVPTGLQQIRSMALGRVDDGGDAFIVAGATTTGGVAVLERTDGGRNLTLVASNQDVQNRTSFVFLPSA